MDVDRKGHLVELQSIRGIASLMVLVGHSGTFLNSSTWFGISLETVTNGRAAVVTFFVLSGYVLARMLAGKHLGTGLLTAFYFRRLFRIYPALLIATLLGLLYMFVYRHVHIELAPWYQAHFSPDRFSSVAIMLAFLGLGAHLLPQVWTIGVELVGSALMPLFIWFLDERQRWSQVIFGILLAIGVTIGPMTPYSTLMYMPAFFLGAWIYAMPPLWRVKLQNLRHKRFLLALTTVFLIGIRSLFNLPYGNPLLFLEEMCCSGFIISLLVYSNVDVPLLRSRYLEHLGDISYSLYLFHFPIFLFIATALQIITTWLSIHLNPDIGNLSNVALTFAVTMQVAGWSYRYIELPGIQWGKRFLNWWSAHRLPS
jgi:peptidoglycan/LPS O-acetylase OafA/YrhL